MPRKRYSVEQIVAKLTEGLRRSLVGAGHGACALKL